MSANSVHESMAVTEIESRDKDAEAISLYQSMYRQRAMLRLTPDGVIEYANPLLQGMLGYSQTQLTGQHHSMLCLPGTMERDEYKSIWDRTRSGQALSVVLLHVGSDGREHYVRTNFYPVSDGDPVPRYVMAFIHEITPDKQGVIEDKGKVKAITRSQAVIEFDMSGNVLTANDNFLHTMGYSLEELVGQLVSVLAMDGDEVTLGCTNDWAELRGGRAVTGERRVRSSSGGEAWLQGTASPVMGLDGRLSKVLMLLQDVTETKHMRVDSEGKLNAIHRAQAVIEFDLTGKVLGANENFLKLMGYSLEEIQGRHHRMFVDKEFAATAEYLAFWERLSRGEFMAGEFKRLARGDREVWIHASYNPVLNLRGEPIKVVKFASDVTQSKLRTSEFQAKVQAIDLSQAVIEFDLDGHVTAANRNFLKAMGYTLREIAGQHHSLFCRPEYTQSEEYRDFWLRLNEGQFVEGRFQRVGKYGREVWIQATYNPILDLNGKVCKIVKFAYDVTKEVDLERRIASRAADMTRGVSALESNITVIAANSGVASEMATESRVAAEKGFEALKKSTLAIESIQTGSVRVSEIVRVISELASQTNLLAFNAAIEAARAGEHGIGFSVVAGEVRKLAERSAQAAQEITKLIDETVRQVDNGAEVSREAARSFEGILSAVGRTSDSVIAIAQSSEHQRVAAGEVAQLIQTLTSADAPRPAGKPVGGAL